MAATSTKSPTTHAKEDYSSIENAKICNIYAQYQKKKAAGGFPGIQQNIAISLLGFVLFLLIFSFFRRRLWDYGVWAVIKRQTKNEDLVDSKQFFEPRGRKIRRPRDPVDPSLYKKTKGVKEPETKERFKLRWWIRLKERDHAILQDHSLFGWIRMTLALKTEDFLHAAGPDCVKYLIFQRHLIFLTFIWAVVSCSITLPINDWGTGANESSTLRSDADVFRRFSITNLLTAPRYLPIHLTLSVLLILLTIYVLRHFSEYLAFYDDYEDDAFRSVFIQGITRAHNAHISEGTIRDHLEEVYPNVEIREVLLIYNFSELFDHMRYLRDVHQALLHYEAYGQLYGRVPKIVGCCCGICCYYKLSPCRPCCGTVDALDFYEEQEIRFKKLLMYEAGSRLKSRSLGMAVITFQNVEMAFRFLNDHSWQQKYFEKTPTSECSRRLGVHRWKVSLAPYALDLQWPNIKSGVTAWYIRFFLLNLLTIFVISIYSTPVYLLQGFTTVIPLANTNADDKSSAMNVTNITKAGDKSSAMNVTNNTNPTDNKKPPEETGIEKLWTRFANDTLPVLLLLLFAITMPSLVVIADLLAGFWTRSSENRSRMMKTYFFLVLMVIILPSIGLVTLTKFMAEQNFNGLIETVFRWECILAPQNGEFFVNYMCTATFVGTLSELLRIPELILFCINACCLQSPGELRSLKLQMQYEFQLGVQYAYSILYYVMFAVFSFVFPIITPFGFCYMMLKHFVDMHNIYFVYAPCPTTPRQEIHGLACKFVMFGNYLAHFVVVAFCITQAYYHKLTPDMNHWVTPAEQNRFKRGLIFYSIVCLAATLVPFVLHCFCGFCPTLAPVFYRRMSDPDVACGPFAPSRRLYYPNRLEILADEELKGFYTKAAANRRFAPAVFHELTFLTSITGFMNQKCLPAHDSSDSDSDDGEVKKSDLPEPQALPDSIIPLYPKPKLVRSWPQDVV